MERPDLSHMSVADLIEMARQCAQSRESADREFGKFCIEEIAARNKPKPVQEA